MGGKREKGEVVSDQLGVWRWEWGVGSLSLSGQCSVVCCLFSVVSVKFFATDCGIKSIFTSISTFVVPCS